MNNQNENREVAIQLSGVKKMYKLGQIGGGTLQGDLQSWWARVRGKEDPNTKIGQEQRLVGQTFMALNGIDLTVYKGEALGIIGGNGAGKSTMLKLLSRVTAPTEGEIDLFGRITSMLEVGTGFNGEMTGRENVYLNGSILGMTKAEIDAKMEDIIEFSEVREFIDTPVKRYSSGMYVKLAFSVAAHLDSEIMIMDEVLAVGDMAFQKKCLNRMKDAAQQEGRTVLYVSHNMNTIRQLCDRCIVLNQGKIEFEGDVDSAINIYMNRQSDSILEMDLRSASREFWVPDRRIMIEETRFIGKLTTIFEEKETMDIQIIWKNIADVDSLSLRIEVWTTDDLRVGSYMLYDFYSGFAMEEKSINIKLDISSLRDSTYRLVYAFFCKDQYGNNMDYDIVYGLTFTKMTGKEEEQIIWRPKVWGYVQLPKPEILIMQ